MSAEPTGHLNQPYSIDLYTTGGQAIKWVVYWTPTVTNTYFASAYQGGVFPAQFQVQHTYTTAPTTPIKAVATWANNQNVTSTAYFSMNFNYGNNHFDGDGQTLYNPYGNVGNISQDAMVVDNSPEDTRFFGDSFVAHSYIPSPGANPQFAVTLIDAGGQFVSSWGTNGTLVVPSFGGGSDVPYAISMGPYGEDLVVVGKCISGWAIAIIDTALVPGGTQYGNLRYTSPNALEPGQANAVAVEQSDGGDHFVVVGTNGAAMVAAAFKTGFSGGMADAPPDYGQAYWSGTGIKTIDVPTGLTGATANAVLENDDGSEGEANNEGVIVGGSAYYNSGQCGGVGSYSDFMLVELNDADGSVDTSFGNNGTVLTNFENYEPCSCGATSYDYCYSLADWFDSSTSNQYVYAIGSSNAAEGQAGSVQQFAVARYDTFFGRLDTRFGFSNSGLALGPAGVARSGVVNPTTGALVTAGSVNSDFEVAQFLSSNGSLDTSFGNNGVMETDFGTTATNNNSTDSAWSVGFQGNWVNNAFVPSSILVCGTSTPYGSTNGQIALADYLLSNQVVIS